MIKISPSILSCDYGIMAQELKCMEDCGVELMHIDVMDGHFVPNITLGAPVVKCIKKYTTVPFDVHLMISNPIEYIEDFSKAGADLISFHIESDSPVKETIQKIKENGVKAAIAIKPGTPASLLMPYLDELSMVLVMTVEPGFGGQSFMCDMMDKVREIREEIRKRCLDIDIEVDGGINAETIEIAAKAGANVFVSGSAIFSSDDRKATVAQYKERAERNFCK